MTAPAVQKRFDAMLAVCTAVRTYEVTENGPTVVWHTKDAAEVAPKIRTLAPLGRTDRWKNAIEAWATQVEDATPETFKWAFDQFSIFASHAAE